MFKNFTYLNINYIVAVHKEKSPAIRRFFKTEWTKPKFNINKPYTSRRDKDTERSLDGKKESKKKVKEVVSELATATAKFSSNPNLKMPYCRLIYETPLKILHLNLQRLLSPPMAAVSFAFVRHYSDKEVFWRPKDRIPKENDWVKRMRNPANKRDAQKEAKYLLLSYGNSKAVPNRKRSATNRDLPKSKNANAIKC